MLFAETDTTTTATVSVLVTAAVSAVIHGLLQLRKQSSEGSDKKRVDTITEYGQLLEIFKKRLEGVERELVETRKRETECVVKCAILEAKVEYLMKDKTLPEKEK